MSATQSYLDRPWLKSYRLGPYKDLPPDAPLPGEENERFEPSDDAKESER